MAAPRPCVKRRVVGGARRRAAALCLPCRYQLVARALRVISQTQPRDAVEEGQGRADVDQLGLAAWRLISLLCTTVCARPAWPCHSPAGLFRTHGTAWLAWSILWPDETRLAIA